MPNIDRSAKQSKLAFIDPNTTTGGNMRDPDQAQLLCPYCGEQIDIQIDPAGGDEEYVEDCSVCCRPILLQVTRDENGEPSVTGTRESD